MHSAIYRSMERIHLTKDEKIVFRLISQREECPDGFPPHIFSRCVRSLERKGLVKGAYVSGGGVIDARLSPDGEIYLAENPKLTNPIDWNWIITTSIAASGAIAAVLGLFIACNFIL